MAVYKTSNSGLLTRVQYSSFLAGNTKFEPNYAVGAYDSIATTTVGAGGTASVIFSSIPATYTHLQVRILGKSGYTGGTGPDNFDIRFNSDSTQTNYNRHLIRGNGTNAAALYSNDNVIVACISTNADNADTYGAAIIDVLDYANTNKFKTTRVLGGVEFNTTSGHIVFESVLWRNTAAINTLYVAPGNAWAVDTSIALYGIKGA